MTLGQAVQEECGGGTRLWDAHAHLQDPVFHDRIGDVLQRAADAGVERIVVNGTSPADWDAVAHLAQESTAVVPAYGVHPLYVAGLAAGWAEDLAARLDGNATAVIGEIGLDRLVLTPYEDLQHRVFRAQLRLARQLGRPATIHCRRAWDAVIAALEEEGPFPGGLVFHSYGGGKDLVARLTKLNGWFSFSGTLTWPRNRRGPAAAAAAPPDRILVETDSPDLPPWRGTSGAAEEPNEPANLAAVVAALAAVRGGRPAEWAEITADNARRVFEGAGRRSAAG